LRLISDILYLSRIESGGLSLSLEPVDIVEVLQEVITTLEPAAARAQVTIDKTRPDSTPMVHVDRTRFAQILLNFGSNAIKYNRSGGTVALRVSTPSDAFVRISVIDNGFGIPLAKQDKLFQPFQRAGQETGPIEGTGIGLAISKRLAELMHGSVGFRSIAGEGSTFWVEMPVTESSPRLAATNTVRETGLPLVPARSQRLVLY